MTSSPTVCWVLVNSVPYHEARIDAASRRPPLRLSVIQLTSEDAFPILQQPGAQVAKNLPRRTLFSNIPQKQIGGRALVKRLHTALDELHPSVVCINGWSFGGGIAALAWCLSRKVPAIMMSESTAGDEPRYWWKEAIKRRVVGLCSAGLVGGSPHRQYLATLGASVDRVFMGYDAVDNEHFRQGAAQARRSEERLRASLKLPKRYFMSCSRFSKKKNLFRLLHAYARYLRDAPSDPWSLVMVGDGELREELVACRDQLGLKEQVLLPGAISYRELPACYGLAGAFVHASTVEQWGLVVNEAMAAGLPVIVSNRCGCASDLVSPGVNGFLFDPFDIGELAGLMRDVSSESFDRQAFAEAGQQIVARWSPKRFAEGLAGAVETACRATLPTPNVVDRLLLWTLRHR